MKLKMRFKAVPLSQVPRKEVELEERVPDMVPQTYDVRTQAVSSEQLKDGGKREVMAKRIFVVDDEACIADTLAVILRKSGYEANAFYNAQSALVEIESCCPELVISDVVMPGMNGVEMAVLIKERHPACKVLLFSGNATTVDLLEETRRRGYDFELLTKPVHPSDLLARVADISEYEAA